MKRSVRLLALGLLVSGCARESRQTFDVGVHHVSIAIGPDWESADQGRRHLLRRGELQLVIEDLGPAGRDGIRREIERAHDLWRRGQDREARSLMRMVPVSDELFSTPDQRRAFWQSWSDVSDAPEALVDAEADARFDRLLDEISTLRDRAPGAAIDEALRTLGEDSRRDVATRASRAVDGRTVVVVETWNRLSHDDPRRFAFVIDAGDLLVLRIDRGPWPAAGIAFERTLRSLELVGPPVQSVVGDRRSNT